MPQRENTFEALVKAGRYVDQTLDLEPLLREEHYAVLCRPDGFGKTTLLDTIECLFSGRKELFAGTAAQKLANDMPQCNILRLDFDKATGSIDNYHKLMDEQLTPYEDMYLMDRHRDHGYDPTHIGFRLQDIIVDAHEKTGRRSVLLMDDYDVPLFRGSATETFDDEGRRKRRGYRDNNPYEELRQVIMNDFCLLKSLGPHLQFVFLTCRVRILLEDLIGGLDNLVDVSYYWRLPNLCLLSRADILRDRAPELEALAKSLNLDQESTLDELERWYGGYYYAAEHRQPIPQHLNLRSTLRALDSQRFEAYLEELDPLRFWPQVDEHFMPVIENADGTIIRNGDYQEQEARHLRYMARPHGYAKFDAPVHDPRGACYEYMSGCGLLAKDPTFKRDYYDSRWPALIPNIEALTVINDYLVRHGQEPVSRDSNAEDEKL